MLEVLVASRPRSPTRSSLVRIPKHRRCLRIRTRSWGSLLPEPLVVEVSTACSEVLLRHVSVKCTAAVHSDASLFFEDTLPTKPMSEGLTYIDSG